MSSPTSSFLKPIVFLVDNGSTSPTSQMALRQLAATIAERSKLHVIPAGFRHSNEIPVELIDGKPARVFQEALEEQISLGEKYFVVIPFVFANGMIASGVEKIVVEKKKQDQELHFEIEDVLFDHQSQIYSDGAHNPWGVVQILKERIKETMSTNGLTNPKVILLDHGSPSPHAAMIRNFAAGQLSVLLSSQQLYKMNKLESLSETLEGLDLNEGNKSVDIYQSDPIQVRCCVAASMERREGDQYEFNEPLLEKILEKRGFNSGEVIISMMFLLPGRHAGSEGDVEQICANAVAKSNGKLKTFITPLVGTHPWITEILLERLRKVVLRRIQHVRGNFINFYSNLS